MLPQALKSCSKSNKSPNLVTLLTDEDSSRIASINNCQILSKPSVQAAWASQCDQKKSPNVYKSCPKMISLEKLKILTPLQKLPKNVGDLGKLIVATGFEKLLKVQ